MRYCDDSVAPASRLGEVGEKITYGVLEERVFSLTAALAIFVYINLSLEE